MRTCRTCAHRKSLDSEAPCFSCLEMDDRPQWQPTGSLLVDGAAIDIELPLAPAATGVEAEVCADIARRQAMGVAKYGTTVADNPLTHRQWLQHAYEEALDMAIYLKRAMYACRT